LTLSDIKHLWWLSNRPRLYGAGAFNASRGGALKPGGFLRLFDHYAPVQGAQVLTMIRSGCSAHLGLFYPWSGVVVMTRKQYLTRTQIAKMDGENKVHFLNPQARRRN